MYDILINTLSHENWPRGAQYGAQLASLLQASVTGAYVYPSPLYATPSFSTPEVIEAVLETCRTLEAGALAAERPFIDWANGMGAKHAAWAVGQGNLPDALVQIACWHDLLVLERNPGWAWASPSDLASLILAVDLPCIVVPPQPVRKVALSRVAIAWNGASEAVRAVHAALPLLQQADEVLLLRGAPRNSYEGIVWKPPFDIDTYLKRHGVRARSQDLQTGEHGAGQALLEQSDRFHADLLVMGAYGHSRFSEWVLGGATRDVLADAWLPVLFRH